MELKKDGRFLDDVQSLKAVIASMPLAERLEYESYGCRAMETVFPNRYLVVYNLVSRSPQAIELWRFGDINMDRMNGPVAELNLPDGKVVPVSITPKKVGGRDLYLHIPQSFELKWKGKDTPRGVQFVPHYCVLVKSLSREHSQIDGHTYCVTLNKFRERFPEVTLRY
jgi:hypothetical protein